MSLDHEPSSGTARRGLAALVGIAAQGICRLLLNVVIGRVGGTSLLGLTQSAVSVGQLASLLGPTSTGATATRSIAQERGGANYEVASQTFAHLRRRFIQTTFVAAVTASSVWVATGIGTTQQAAVVAAMVLGLAGYAFTRGVQFGTGQVARSASWDIVCGIAGTAGAAALLAVDVRGVLVLVPVAIAYLAYTLFSWPRGWDRGAVSRLSRKRRRAIDSFILLGVAGTVASAGFLQLSVLAASFSGGLAFAGNYAAALALATPMAMLAGALSSALFPAMSELWSRGEHAAVASQTDRATRIMVAAMIGALGFIALASRPVIDLIFGPGFDDAKLILPLLVLAIAMNAVSMPAVNSITSRSSQGMAVSALSSVVGLSTGLCVWVLAVDKDPVLYVPLGYVSGVFVIAAVPTLIAWRRDRQRWGALMGRLVGAVVLVSSLIHLQARFGTPPWTDFAIACTFTLAWALLHRADIRAAQDSLKRRTDPVDRSSRART